MYLVGFAILASSVSFALPFAGPELWQVSENAARSKNFETSYNRPHEVPASLDIRSETFNGDPASLKIDVALLTPNQDHRKDCTDAQKKAFSAVGVLFGSPIGSKSSVVDGTATVIRSDFMHIAEGRFAAMSAHTFIKTQTGKPFLPRKDNPTEPDFSRYSFFSPICQEMYHVKRGILGTHDPSWKERSNDFAFVEIADEHGQPLCKKAHPMDIRIMEPAELLEQKNKDVLATVGYYGSGPIASSRCKYSHGNFWGNLNPPNESVIAYNGTLDTEAGGSGGALIFDDRGPPKWAGMHVAGSPTFNFGVLANRKMLDILQDFVDRRN